MNQEENLITDKKLRDQLSERIDVLDKVKKIVTLPETDFVTLDELANYYLVHTYHLKKVVSENKEEIALDGCLILTKDQYKNYCSVDTTLVQTQGATTYTLPSGEEVTIPNRGLRVFSKRAVLRIGMLLSKSQVARRLRTALLDVATGEVPVITTVQDALVKTIDCQKKHLADAVTGIVNGDTASAIKAMSDLCQDDQKYINELSQRLDKAETKVKESSSKVNAYDRLCNSEQTYKMKDASKILNWGRNKLFAKLRQEGYLMNDNTPYQKYVNQGLFKERITFGGSKSYNTTLMTDKGITYFDKKFFS